MSDESLFDSLPDFIKSTHWTRPGHKEWRYCAYCRRCQNDEIRLKLCEGCVRKQGRQIYYCEKKCQKLDWSNHKSSCLLGKADPGNYNERSTKLLNRWMCVNLTTLRWCVEQVYYYNPGANPCTTLISFWFDGETKRLTRISMRLRDDREAGYFKPMPHLYTVHLECPKKSGGSRDAFYYQFDDHAVPSMREEVVGHPQYPWIAATVFGTLTQTSPSAAVADERLNLLCAAVTYHTSNGTLVLPNSFHAQPIPCVLNIPSTQMLLWTYKLRSIDLWGPFSDPKQLAATMVALNYQLARSRANLGSQSRLKDARFAGVDHSTCQGKCHGHFE